MSYSTDPATDWDRWISKQESTHDTLHPTARLLETLAGRNGAVEAEIGEYGVESKLLADMVRAAIKSATGRAEGDGRDIVQRAEELAREVMRNRDTQYWELADETKMRAIAARSNWCERIPTIKDEPRLTLVNGNVWVSLVLNGGGFEACLRMDQDTMRALRDALNERLDKADTKEAA